MELKRKLFNSGWQLSDLENPADVATKRFLDRKGLTAPTGRIVAGLQASMKRRKSVLGISSVWDFCFCDFQSFIIFGFAIAKVLGL